jgi:hypothetical protein
MTYSSSRMTDDSRTHFLNVDLELLAKQDLTALVQAFEPGASAINCIAVENGYFVNLELDIQPSEPEAAIRSFVDLVEKLPPPARVLWDETSKRDLSIGVQAGSTPSSFEVALTPAVLKLAADVGARIVFVVYVHAPGV